jgi:hypothetical protein
LRLTATQQTGKELALFNLAIASKRRGSHLLALDVRNVVHGKRMAACALVTQQKTH